MRSCPPFALLLALAACSSQGAGSSTGPTTPPAEGAVNMEVYATPEQTCPAGNVHVDIGNAHTSPAELVVDGDGDAKVTCSVVLHGQDKDKKDVFAASGSITQGAFSFSFKDVLTTGSSATGTVAFKDPMADAHYTSGKMPCVFQFAPAPDSGQWIAAGKISVGFDCASIQDDAEPTKSCSSRYGYVHLERCAAK